MASCRRVAERDEHGGAGPSRLHDQVWVSRQESEDEIGMFGVGAVEDGLDVFGHGVCAIVDESA